MQWLHGQQKYTKLKLVLFHYLQIITIRGCVLILISLPFSCCSTALLTSKNIQIQMELQMLLHCGLFARWCLHTGPGCLCMTFVSLWPSSQSAAGVSPIHAEADGAVPNIGEGSNGVTGKETL